MPTVRGGRHYSLFSAPFAENITHIRRNYQAIIYAYYAAIMSFVRRISLFDSTALNLTMSNDCPATNCFSLRFSSSFSQLTKSLSPDSVITIRWLSVSDQFRIFCDNLLPLIVLLCSR